MQQAAQMQEQMARMQEEAEKETAQSSVGGGLVKVTANGAGEVLAIEISPDAIDPDDPEALADLVLAGVNEALRSARAGVEAKAQQMLGDMGLGGLGLPGLGEDVARLGAPGAASDVHVRRRCRRGPSPSPAPRAGHRGSSEH